MKKLLLILITLMISAALFASDARVSIISNLINASVAMEKDGGESASTDKVLAEIEGLTRAEKKRQIKTYSQMADWKIDRTIRNLVAYMSDDVPTSTVINLNTLIDTVTKGDSSVALGAYDILKGEATADPGNISISEDNYDLFRAIAKRILM
ncbi:MAG TPA: hypothetical protein IAB12_00720 [Candidatus Ornithospirochaeta avicola]|uniref:Uncharacterized protein n=1 Tax=Candidatus Ornithospirochaeta avicola TaxID=2840896 RepID=A0A9D1PTG0_9SPIO|nr:hypothetical protein [Candidatus Ornithospirochaeta avicola]